MYCNNCGKQIPDHSKFCPECGQPVQAAPRPRQTSRSSFKEEQFSYCTYMGYRGKLKVTGQSVEINNPKKPVFGIIPGGRERNLLPLRNISDTRVDIGYNWENVLVGAFFVLCALFGSGDASGATVLLLILGIGVIISSRKVILTIYHSGTGYRIPVMFFEKFRLNHFFCGI